MFHCSIAVDFFDLGQLLDHAFYLDEAFQDGVFDCLWQDSFRGVADNDFDEGWFSEAIVDGVSGFSDGFQDEAWGHVGHFAGSFEFCFGFSQVSECPAFSVLVHH